MCSQDFWVVMLKPCPWCGKTPNLSMPIKESTWIWHIRCDYGNCGYQPKGKHLAIRKKQRLFLGIIFNKLLWLCDTWNKGSWDFKPYEKLLIDLFPLRQKMEQVKKEYQNEVEFRKTKN